jgi:hypothetical protein
LIVFKMLGHPYGSRDYRAARLITGGAVLGGLLLALELVRAYWNPRIVFRPLVVLSIFPILALVHLSLGVRHNVRTAHNAPLRDYLREHASIAVGKPFRGYTSTVWVDKNGQFSTGPNDAALQDLRRYVYGLAYFRDHYGETFTDTDLWRFHIPTFEEYGEWTSVQAHAFAAKAAHPGRFQPAQ